MESEVQTPLSSTDTPKPPMSLDIDTALDTLLERQVQLTSTLRSRQDELARLEPQLAEARTEAAKPPAQPQGSSSEALLASATQAALERYQWQAKVEGLQVAIQWTQEQIQATQRQLQEVETAIDRARHQEAIAREAKQGVDDLNAAIDTVKQRLKQLKAEGCLHLYTVNLPEFFLDERGQIQVRPHSFRIS